ncbi:MAG: SusD/RagB family nutrient-binding outer membrane lipoprotein [Prevotellaceae bacterium]|jgi:hypothetical protein|nr:SusD/RagB family nutrient-binding outer membrane lipoprotein [Prevotellaceae bacterium]
MKKLHYSLLLAAVVSGSTTVSCSGDLTDLNDDPKSYVNAKPGALFLSGQKSLADTYGSAAAGVAPFRVLAQVWTENTYNNEAKYNLSSADAPFGWWRDIYTKALVNLKQAKIQYAKEETNAGVLKNNLAIIDLLEVYAYYLLVNTYGDIPYTEALQNSTPFPRYDDAHTITLDLLRRLDADLAALDVSYGAVGAADQIYNGNVGKWRKFAATLKLKTALLLAGTEPQTAGAKALEAVAAGVFTSNDDNALFKYDGANAANSNPVWQAVAQTASNKNYSPAGFFINTLRQLNDPRLGLLFTQDAASGYSGGTAGAINNFDDLSRLSAFWLNSRLPVTLLDYAETEFLLAEAIARGIAVGGTAEEHYKKAIKASIRYWGGDDAGADDYINSTPAIQYNPSEWKELIGYQQWIAFADRGWDAWTNIRRLGYPNIDSASPPVNAVGTLPRRFNYPPVEQTSNPDNWAAAVARITGKQDLTGVKLFWQN